jgi:hypothetical protein
LENQQPEEKSPTSRESGKSVLGPEMWSEVLQRVIAPRIASAIRLDPPIENRHELHKRFCELNSVRISYSTFSGWCEDLGITFRKRIEVTIPGWKPVSQPVKIPLRAVSETGPENSPTIEVSVSPEPDVPIRWDPPKPPPSRMFSNDGLPDVLPGGMRGPAFLDSNDYAN